MIFGRQPARWIALLVALALGALQTIHGDGLISDALTGKVTDFVNAIAQLLQLLSPLIAGELIRPLVTPVAAPVLPAGTKVKTPAGDTAVVKHVTA